jgi:hypothetical protein
MEVLERFAHGDLNASEDTMVWRTTWEASSQGDLSIDMHFTPEELGSGRLGTNVCAEEGD